MANEFKRQRSPRTPLRVFVFEPSEALRKLLAISIEAWGHDAEAFADRYSCPLYTRAVCRCPVEQPCADAVIVNASRNVQEHLQILVDQASKGCKLISANKAIMSASFTAAEEMTIRYAGFHTIRQPFRMAKLVQWLDECSGRIRARRQEGDIPSSPPTGG